MPFPNNPIYCLAPGFLIPLTRTEIVNEKNSRDSPLFQAVRPSKRLIDPMKTRRCSRCIKARAST